MDHAGLRISGESIFTGLNNFKVYTVKDVRYNEYFGFTDTEVRQMLEYYGLSSQYNAVKEWYDGYMFGNLGIYCPWDVINYCGDLRDGSVTEPQNYWVNTSSNDIIRRFLSRAKTADRNDIEQLVNGNSIKKTIRQELTYRDLDSNPDNLWSILFTTGYLTQRSAQTGELTELVIPNREIRWIFIRQIREWFRWETEKNMENLEGFCRAFLENDTAAIEEGFNAYLKKTISIRDTHVKKEMKENFYHGILLGLFGNMDGWDVQSNAESGDGYSDISIEIEDQETGIVIELKYAEKRKGKKTAAWGAGQRGVTLLNVCGFSCTDIEYIVDVNRNYWWKYVSDGGIQIVPPDWVEDHFVDSILILATGYADEILSENRDYVEKGGEFIKII